MSAGWGAARNQCMYACVWVGGCDGRSQGDPLPQPVPLRARGSRQASHLSSQPSPAAAVQSLSPALTPSCPPLRFPHLRGVGMCLRSHYAFPPRGGRGRLSSVSRTLDSIQHGRGQLQTPTQACLLQAEVSSPAPSQLFQLTVLGRPAQGPLFRGGWGPDLLSSVADWPQVGA